MLQEGMFDTSSPGWLGFIEATSDANASWKMTQLPTAYVFAFAISWVYYESATGSCRLC